MRRDEPARKGIKIGDWAGLGIAGRDTMWRLRAVCVALPALKTILSTSKKLFGETGRAPCHALEIVPHHALAYIDHFLQIPDARTRGDRQPDDD